MHLDKFVDHIKKTYDSKLKAIVLFGSAASGDYSKKFSDFNLIIVLDEIIPLELKKISKLTKKWTMAGNSIPLFFDINHIETSADVFPIEFHDIKENRKILYGTDPFMDVKIDNKNLRHQCESELKGKILYLQSRFVEISDKDKKIAKLMIDSLSTFTAIFKGIMHLVGQKPPSKKRDLVEKLSTLINFNPNIFMDLLDVRDQTAILPRTDATEKFEGYLTELKKIAQFVDKYSV